MLDQLSDAELWQAVLVGDTQAFEKVVARYQGVVSAIAYSRLGSLEASQDVAQETFWVAWSSRANLRETTRLAAWLCGIARNLSHQQTRRSPLTVSSDWQPTDWDYTSAISPLEQSIAAEQAVILWQAVHELPEHYRDAMVLYYRQENSISEVAAALELSDDAVKQRLSRARAMLRDELAGVIEETLVRSRPGKAFTAKVMSGLVAMGVASQATTVSAASAAASAVSSTVLGKATSSALGGLAGGLASGFLGLFGGLAGAWLGTYMPAEMAPTETERQMLRYHGRAMRKATGYMVTAMLAAVAIGVWMRSTTLYVSLLIGIQLIFTLVVVIYTIKMRSQVNTIRKSINAEDDPNQSVMRKRFINLAGRRRGVCYTSRYKFVGWPLLDIQFADPDSDKNMPIHKSARGWLAIGDRAFGVLAIGGMAFGPIAFGGLAIGGLAVGGGALGLLSFGGLALGGIAMGGGAIGWQAVGGGAIALHSAFGGWAVAWHLAGGGFALAHDIAAGSGGAAAEFNTAAAKEAVDALWLKNAMDVCLKNNLFYPIVFCISLVPIVLNKIAYRSSRSIPIDDNR